MLLHRVTAKDAHRAGLAPEQAAGEPDRGRLAGAVGSDEPEHLAGRDFERQRRRPRRSLHIVWRRDRSSWLRQASGVLALLGSSASTGIPDFNTPSRLSTVTLIRYTSLDRSSAVCTFRGVNSALGEMKVMVPSSRCPASVTSVTFCPTRSRGTTGSST